MKLDVPAIKEHLRPYGPWAIAAGKRVTAAREAAELAPVELATVVGVSLTTIKEIEAGQLVPREYLRHAIAWTTGAKVADLWPPLAPEDLPRRKARATAVA